MSTIERWQGATPGGQVVMVYLVRVDIWPANAWRVEWGPASGARSGREVFDGLGMEERARAGLADKRAELGTDWERVER